MDKAIQKIIDQGKANAFLAFLYQYITEKRRIRFDTVSALRTRYLTVVVENIYQSHNASAVLRTCDCFGVQDVHIIENENPFNPNAEIALGAENWLDINRYFGDKSLNNCYQTLKNKDYIIVATTPHFDAVSIDELPVDKPIALVFGTEKDGLSKAAIEQSDIRVSLPMYGFTESFNISVSVALFLQKTMDKMRQNNTIQYLSEEERTTMLIQWCLRSIHFSDNLASKFENAEND